MLRGKEAVKNRIRELQAMPNIGVKEKGTLDALLLINEMMCRGIGVLPVDAKLSGAATYHIEDGKLRMPYLSIAGCGSNAAFKLKEVVDAGNYMCIDDIQQQSGLNSTVIDKMREMGVFAISRIPRRCPCLICDITAELLTRFMQNDKKTACS